MVLDVSNFISDNNGKGGSVTLTVNGQAVAVWNGLGPNGQTVPNGYYHFVLQETIAGGNPIILSRDAYIGGISAEPVLFTAKPNLLRGGGMLQLSATSSGFALAVQAEAKVYSLSGELIRDLPLVKGSAVWDTRNQKGQESASGLYLVVLDWKNPVNGARTKRSLKVLIIR